ncbi:MAG TPA: hemerythrin domain-containing protein [Aquifex aeolicus]|uniref:Hemerythrin domain-containing protein n=1 Tax=Aquifex aeolicus TaxID=63363 RepID=A0A7C5L3T9_AQUAO|nr:hemerythrin domain-containing protein [Aquifex aeolicus]
MEEGRLNELIEDLLREHREFLKILREIEVELSGGVSAETLTKLLNVMKREVEEHALKEEGELAKLAEDRFDPEALVFAHDNIRDRVAELEDLLEDYEKGKRPTEVIKREALSLIKLVRDHFQEEENLFFPLMRGEDLEHLGGD